MDLAANSESKANFVSQNVFTLNQMHKNDFFCVNVAIVLEKKSENT